MNLEKILDNFEFIERHELRRSLDVVSGRTRYRVEIFHSYSNLSAPWTVRVSAEQDGQWKHLTDFPWVADRDEETAIRTALSFLAGRPQ